MIAALGIHSILSSYGWTGVVEDGSDNPKAEQYLVKYIDGRYEEHDA